MINRRFGKYCTRTVTVAVVPPFVFKTHSLFSRRSAWLGGSCLLCCRRPCWPGTTTREWAIFVRKNMYETFAWAPLDVILISLDVMAGWCDGRVVLQKKEIMLTKYTLITRFRYPSCRSWIDLILQSLSVVSFTALIPEHLFLHLLFNYVKFSHVLLIFFGGVLTPVTADIALSPVLTTGY